MEKIVETAGKAVVDLFSNVWAVICGFFAVCVAIIVDKSFLSAILISKVHFSSGQ